MSVTQTYPEPELAARPAQPPGASTPPRIASIDVYRGFVMLLMMAELLHLPQLAAEMIKREPENGFWEALRFHTSHVRWDGCSLHDMIQPSFSFLVGVALPFSIASRLARGHSTLRMVLHAAWRALLLVALGVFLRSVGKPQTNFTFEDTLSQIGLGYVFLFLLGLGRPRWQWAAFVVIVIGYWLAFVIYPAPAPPVGSAPPEFDYTRVFVPADWPHHYEGLMAHWNKNSNLAWSFDQWFLNLFPRKEEFIANRGGYATLSFIPTLATMILGLIAGGWIKRGGPAGRRVMLLVVTGTICFGLGWGAEAAGVCPVVKPIWTPAWVLYSGGICLLILAGVHVVCDVIGLRAWAFPLVVIGMNSIAIYVLVHLIDGFIIESLRVHLGRDVFKSPDAEGKLGEVLERTAAGAAALLVFWLMLFWMYRRKVFIRV